MTDQVCVFQEWMFQLSMQQQSVLLLACRGPDGVAKEHPCKRIVQRYRASVVKAAYLGRVMQVDEFDSTTYMSMQQFSDPSHWVGYVVKPYIEHVDELPHHYHLHMMHGAEILGYKHPDPLYRERWGYFYAICCRDLHLAPEPEYEMDLRLCDWNRKYWA